MAAKRTSPGKIHARDLFEAELARRGIRFDHEPAGTYSVEIDGATLSISLDNVARDHARDGDDGAVARFVDRCLMSWAVPSWQVARSRVYFSAEPSDQDFGDTLRTNVTDTVARVLVVASEDEGLVTWLGPTHLAAWGVTVAQVEQAAGENLDALLRGIDLEVAAVDGGQLGIVPARDPFKAACIFAPSLKAFVSRALGWPIYAVVPCRDFVYLIAERDRGLLDRIGSIVHDEFHESGYPITKEVLSISDDGIDAIGAYP